MNTIFGPSWRTSLTGYISAAAIAIIPVIQSGSFTLESVAIAAAVAILGRFAKDHNVTGA